VAGKLKPLVATKAVSATVGVIVILMTTASKAPVKKGYKIMTRNCLHLDA
jgi:hypothetical protein